MFTGGVQTYIKSGSNCAITIISMLIMASRWASISDAIEPEKPSWLDVPDDSLDVVDDWRPDESCFDLTPVSAFESEALVA